MGFIVLTPLAAAAALIYAWFLARRVLAQDEGNDLMKKISASIREGANAYLRRQYTGVAKFFAVVFVVMVAVSLAGYMNIFIPVSFLTGGFFSGLAGFIGMRVATAANSRTAQAASLGLNHGLKVAFSAGSVMGFTVVGLNMLDASLWYFFLKWFYHALPEAQQIEQIAVLMLSFCMGASVMALFARVGGGIFTKAADVGADLVGKVEAGIPEDDPRNPAVIADNVGDNVGDVAGMGADLYESYAGARLSACALAVTAGLGTAGFILPMSLLALGIFSSIIGSFFVKIGDDTSQRGLLGTLRKGTYVSSLLMAAGSYFLIRMSLGAEHIGLFGAVLIGLLAGNLIGYFTEYYTSDTYKPTQQLAASTKTGAATLIIGGLSLGMLSTAAPVIIVSAGILGSYVVSGGAQNFSSGLFGVALAAVGMLSTLGITLATDAYGPVADNAGGIAEMAGLDHSIRERTDALDSLGNTTAATGKGFAIGSAALTALALIAAYVDQAKLLGFEGLNLSLLNPSVIIGVFIGSLLPYIFTAMTMASVGKAAQSIVEEVRRQFREIKGLMEGTAEPDYHSCVDLCTQAAQKEMLAPSILAIVVPIVVGLVLGVNGVTGLLMGATASGFILAIMMANSGGAWDNAKKYIEAGNLGGKGSDCHKAAVVGDTVGDPFKDTSGPSINILIKLLSTVSIVFAALVVQFSLNL